jgi:hypothetical protein
MRLSTVLIPVALLAASASSGRALDAGPAPEAAQAGKADKAFTMRKKFSSDAKGELKCEGHVKKGGEEVVIKRCARRNFDKYAEHAKKSGIVKDPSEYNEKRHGKLAKTLSFYKDAHEKLKGDYESLQKDAQDSDHPGWKVEEKKHRAVLKKVQKAYGKAIKECRKKKYSKVFKCPKKPKPLPRKPGKPDAEHQHKCPEGTKCGGRRSK